MRLLCSLAMTFSMFSAIPMPKVAWEKENMRYTLALLPLVGVAAGAVLCGWHYLAGLLRIGTPLYAAGIVLLPMAISGGIHTDGFLDTIDALASHAVPDKKREILKDHHVGAFAVIGMCAYMLLYFALAAELERSLKSVLLLAAGQVICRALGAWGGQFFRAHEENVGLLASFRSNEKVFCAAAICVWLLLCAAAVLFVDAIGGAAMLAAGLVCLLAVYFIVKKEFMGMSGDIAGFLIKLSEIAMVAALVAAQKVVAIV